MLLISTPAMWTPILTITVVFLISSSLARLTTIQPDDNGLEWFSKDTSLPKVMYAALERQGNEIANPEFCQPI